MISPPPRRLLLAALAALVACLAGGCPGPHIPTGTRTTPLAQPGAELLERWRWVRVPHVDVRLEAVPGADGGKMVLRATFAKSGLERRFVAFEARPEGDALLAKALVLRCRLTLTEGTAPRLALVVLEGDGGAWFKRGRPLTQGGAFAEARLSVASLRPAAFSQDPDGTLTWDVKTRTWLGLVVDGPAQGVLEISRARFSPEPYRPTEPLRLTGDGPGVWSQSKDPAVTGTITTPTEGPGGAPCMKYEFAMPGGRHMYAIPRTPARGDDFGAYRALRFTYKATLPEGIDGLLVTLQEANGAQYYVDGTSERHAARPAADWTTVTIPFTAFGLGDWSKDDNGRLDLEQVDTICIGCHGTTSAPRGQGVIWVADLEFVP